MITMNVCVSQQPLRAHHEAHPRPSFQGQQQNQLENSPYLSIQKTNCIGNISQAISSSSHLHGDECMEAFSEHLSICGWRFKKWAHSLRQPTAVWKHSLNRLWRQRSKSFSFGEKPSNKLKFLVPHKNASLFYFQISPSRHVGRHIYEGSKTDDLAALLKEGCVCLQAPQTTWPR